MTIASLECTLPNLVHERRLQKLHGDLVAGVDEAGRGPLAGPVVAAAVVLDLDRIPEGINDSKLLTREARERIFAQIMTTARVGIGFASVETIDEINILRASLLAMEQAIAALPVAPSSAIIDGRDRVRAPCHCEALIHGDAISLSIAAASIVAKVTRDKLMAELAELHPGYGWERNMGYGTREHRRGLECLGVTPQHRRSFAPVKALLCA